MKNIKDKTVLCPDCKTDDIVLVNEMDTDWYGNLKYYEYNVCEEVFVSKNNGELAISANR